MQEVLNELFYGNVNPNAKQFARNSEYGRAVKIVSGCEGKLLVLLSGKELELRLLVFGEMLWVLEQGIAKVLHGFRHPIKFCVNAFS